MAVDFKSHVLRRDEKGLFGIPFKRLLGAGVGGGLAYTVLQMIVPAYAIPFGVVLAFCIIILTAQRGGIGNGFCFAFAVVCSSSHRPTLIASSHKLLIYWIYHQTWFNWMAQVYLHHLMPIMTSTCASGSLLSMQVNAMV